jgi:hypothetical protein
VLSNMLSAKELTRKYITAAATAGSAAPPSPGGGDGIGVIIVTAAAGGATRARRTRQGRGGGEKWLRSPAHPLRFVTCADEKRPPTVEEELRALRTTARNYAEAIARLSAALVRYVDDAYDADAVGVALAGWRKPLE